jgi:large repetitive protein
VNSPAIRPTDSVLDMRTAHRRWWKRKSALTASVSGVTKRSVASFATLTILSLGLPLLVNTPPALAASVCPAGTVDVPFTWQGATTGVQAVWNGGNDGYTQSYTFGTGVNQVTMTMAISDPLNRNVDANHLFLSAPWKTTNSFGNILAVTTKSNGAYGAGFLTFGIGTLNSGEGSTLNMSFNRPVVIKGVNVGDIDFSGYKGLANNISNDPEQSFQDQVELRTQRGGNDIPYTVTPLAAGKVTTTGQVTKANYQVGVAGDLNPTDPLGTVVVDTVEPINSFTIKYTNGPDDAAAERLASADKKTYIPAGNYGVSDSQAIRVSGFAVCVGAGSIGDSIYLDNDGDGIQDATEGGIAGVTVYAKDPTGNIVATAVSDANGKYVFPQLPPYTYTIAVDRTTLPGSVNPVPTGDPDATKDGIATVPVTGTAVTNIDFGFVPTRIAGFVYEDANDDGIIATGETKIRNATIELVNSSGTVIGTTTTAADGSYEFVGFAPGTYTVREVQPAGYIDAKDTPGTNGSALATSGNDAFTVTLAAGQQSTENNFGEQRVGSISGKVYVDANNDGTVATTGEPAIAGAIVKLFNAAGVEVASTTTAADGTYTFNNVTPGSYTVREVQPTTYTDGLETPGTNASASTTNDTIAVLLPSGGTSTGNNFGELGASISGVVFHDATGAGVNDATDPKIGAVKVDLISIATGAIVATTTTNATTGAYSFTNLPAGNYTVVETQPAAFGDSVELPGTGNATSTNDQITVPLSASEASTNNDFAEVKGLISGSVYVDANSNGARGLGEAGLSGISIQLLDAAGAVVATTTTDSTGAYSFANLAPGSYRVVEPTQPTGYADGAEDPGTGGATSTVNDKFAVTLTAASMTSTGNDFGEKNPVGTASISGTVFDDSSPGGYNTGFQSAGVELGIAGVTIELLDVNGNVVATTVTNATGDYSFTALPAGDYKVREIQPIAYNDGRDRINANPDSPTNDVHAVTLTTGQVFTEVNFAELPIATSFINGFVYAEQSGNAAKDASDLPLGGVTVRLYTGSTLYAVATTDATGAYSFNVPAGTYTVVEAQPTSYSDGAETTGTGGTSQTIPTSTNDQILVVVGNNVTSAGNNFGETPSKITGVVFVDTNGNGSHAGVGTEPIIGGVTIQLLDASGAVIATTTTDPTTGAYTFDNLPAGSYTVVELQPAAYGDGAESPGTGNTTPSNDRIAVTLSGGEISAANNFGETPGTISGSVYVDTDADGAKNGSETGFAGVTVNLRDSSGIVATTATGPGGTYSFTNLLPGTYHIEEIQPSTYVDAAETAGTYANVSTTNDLIDVVLPAGGNSPANNFGEVVAVPGTISGFVYTDRNGDGVRDASDGPLTGVQIQLVDASGATIATTTTSSTGAYSFPNVTPGTYRVREVQPVGYIDAAETAGTGTTTPGSVSANDEITVVLGNGETSAKNNFGELGATLSGHVYSETDNSGARDAGEPAIGGVTVTLRNASGTPIATTVTDAAGFYSFTDLPAGAYTVVETQPSGYTDAKEHPGTGTTSSTTNDQIAVTLAANGVSTDNDFAEAPPAQAPVRITGSVYADRDNDGVLDLTEVPLPGTTITLLDASGNVVATTTTNATGTYEFTVPAGTYTIVETQPAGYSDGIDTPGTQGALATGNDRFTVTLSPSETSTGNNFGERPARIAGSVFVDANDGGSRDTSEAPIASVTVVLLNAAGATVATTTTAADGTYAFEDLPAGSYRVVETQPAPYLDGKDHLGTGTTALAGNDQINVIVPAGGSSVSNDFGELPPVAPTGTISGTVYTEVDGVSGHSGSDTGLATTLSLIDSNGTVIATTTSDPTTGAYSFPNVPAGTYTVVEAQPAGVLDGLETAGTTATIPPSTNDRIEITLASGASSPGNNFGEQPAVAVLPATISGSVFVDADAAGDHDSGEPAIAGVTVILLDSSGVEVSRTTTAADGTYSFTGLPAGSYTVVEQQPAKYGDGSDIPGTNGATLASDDRVAVTVAAGQTSTANDFGEVGSTISGRTFVDSNNSGGLQPGEPALAGVTVKLVDSTGAVVATTTTGTDGRYKFTNLPADDYRVEEAQPVTHADGNEYPGTGTTSSPANDAIAISLPAGSSSTANDFGEQPLVAPTGSISGFVYVDAGDDGVKGATETPISGTTLQLLDSAGAVVATTTTSADGSYVFSGVPAGTYSVVELQPTGYTDGKDTPGTGSTSSTVNERINIVLPAGGTSTSNNFGEQPAVAVLPATISGFVYVDTNDDGLHAGDSGIATTTVKLIAPDGTVVATTTTGSDGSYSFPNVPAGTYRVVETQPAGYLDGKDTPGTGGTAGSANDTLIVTVGAGATSTENNFGEKPPVAAGASISGNVFREVDGALGRGGTDVAIPSVVIRLLHASSDEVARTTTLPDGSYTFTGLPAGSYVVAEEQPAGLPDTTDYAGTGTTSLNGNDRIAVTVAAGDTSTGNDFSELAPLTGTATIRGTVFGDANGNGIKSTNEPGIANVTVRLLDASGNVVATTTTALDGTYSFVNVPAGTYTIEEVQPVGWNDGTDTPGVGATSTGNDKFRVVVATGATLIENNFAELGALIKGNVFVDANNDGVNTSELPIALVTLQLLDSNGQLVATTTTDSTGAYQFGPVPTGTYTIVETQPSGFDDGKEHPGTGAVAGISNDQIVVTTTAGTTSTGNDFGEREKTPPSLITGTVYRDRSANSTLDSGDPGIEGVTVKLLDVDGNVFATVITGPSGVYDFPDVPAGTYFIVEEQPSLYVDGADTPGGLATIASNDRLQVTVANGQTSAANNFGELAKPGTIGGRVFADQDNDGLMDSDPKEVPLAGVTVQLQDLSGNVVATTVTATDGTYTFLNVIPGYYRIVEIQPGNALDGKESPGLNNTSTINDRIDLYLSDGAASVDNDFAETPSDPLKTPGRISGTVAIDINNDGRADTSETGIAGVTIQLLDVAGNVVGTTITGTDGSYVFTDLIPGAHMVREVQPANFGDGKDAPGFNGASAAGNDTFNVTLAPGTWSHSNDFGEGFGAILGSVVIDNNNDGIADGPIANVVIELINESGAVIRTTATLPDGSFSFTGLGAGTYKVRERQPEGYIDGPDVAGDSGSVSTNDELVVTLTNTTNASGLRFMEKPVPFEIPIVQVRPDDATTPPAPPVAPPAPVAPVAPVASETPPPAPAPAVTNKVGGKVWLDSNRDAANGPAENGVAAVELRIYNRAGVLVATTSTKPDGTWTVDLPEGEYELEPVLPSGFSATTVTRIKFTVVLGQVIEAEPIGIVSSPQPPAELALAFTGAPVRGLLRDGGVLIMSGFALVALSHRRRRHNESK